MPSGRKKPKKSRSPSQRPACGGAREPRKAATRAESGPLCEEAPAGPDTASAAAKGARATRAQARTAPPAGSGKVATLREIATRLSLLAVRVSDRADEIARGRR